MKRGLIALVLAGVAAVPAAAQAPRSETTEIQRALNDPAITDQLTRVLPALGDALLDMRVGEVKAALEGRPATPADKRTTVRDLGRRNDPNFDRKLKADLANSGATVTAGMKAMSAALPAMMDGLQKAAAEMEKATANLPSPTYPRR